MFFGDWLWPLSYFAIDLSLGIRYITPAPVCAGSLKNSKKQVFGSWYLVLGQSLRPSADRREHLASKTIGNSRIRTRKNEKKELRPLGDRSVELHFDVCLQQNA